ncbi:MAG: hypothetical protein ACPGOY_05470 [Rhodospirillaceae bacterium]
MSRTPSLHNLIAALVAAVGFAVLGIPVYQDYHMSVSLAQQAGDATQPFAHMSGWGIGPLSGLMVFTMSVPVVIGAAPSLIMKLVGVLCTFIVGGCLAAMGYFYEHGQMVLMLLAAALALGVIFLVVSQNSRMTRSRQFTVRRLAREIARIIEKSSLALRRHFKEPAQNPQDPEAPLHTVALVDQMVMGVVWQAISLGDPRSFKDSLLSGVAEIADDLKHNRAADPKGHAAQVAKIYLKQIRSHMTSARLEPSLKEIYGSAGRAEKSTEWGRKAAPKSEAKSAKRASRRQRKAEAEMGPDDVAALPQRAI